MEDKEVGELWDLYHRDGGSVVADLIRKLVEERAIHISYSQCGYEGECDCDEGRVDGHIKQALRDFGIDPSTFPLVDRAS